MNKKLALKPLAAAIGLALTAPAFAVTIDFSGSNIYMKFLDGNQRVVSTGSGDTASGSDNGQWTEYELRMKATISKQVEAGVRIQSRSPAAYWTDFGFADETTPTRAKFMKLRGAYVLLTPGYGWLNTALIGSSDWGQFDPFTVGQVRYIDRDNYNGLYFKGSLGAPGLGWEFARVSLPSYLGANWGNRVDASGGSTADDNLRFKEGVYIGQVKGNFGPAKLTASYQWFNDRQQLADATPLNPYDGTDVETWAKNRVIMLKGEGSAGPVDLKAAVYRSAWRSPLATFDWGNSPKSDVNGTAYKLDVGLNSLPVSGLGLNFQLFNIGAGYYSNLAARRESDVLLTEGSEAAWYNWGQTIWLGGAAKDYQQAPIARLTDNGYIDFDEAPNEGVNGWKGITALVNYEVAKIPMSMELTRVDYNYNWQNYSASGPMAGYFGQHNDRKTNIAVFKVGYVAPVLGGLELSAKYKLVDDSNRGQISLPTDDRDTKDKGLTLSVGNQLFSDLYGSVSWGRYSRDITKSGAAINNDKDILSLRLSYNLAGFETGLLSQWVKGEGDPGETGATHDIKQYRMKAFVKAIF